MPACDELEKLIQEQAAADTSVAWPQHAGTLSLDAPIADGKALNDLIGVDQDGALVAFAQVAPLSPKLGRRFTHGTLNGYNNFECRCPECKLAISGWHLIRHDAKKLNLCPIVKKAMLVALKEYMENRALRPQGEAPARPGAFVPKRCYLSIPSPYWSQRWKEFELPPWASFVMWRTFERIKRKAPAAQQR